MKQFKPRKSYSLIAVALAAAGMTATAPALAATLEEVLVSARKVEESMQDVSIAVTAYSGAQIDALIMRDVREMEGLVPNLVIDAVSVAPAGASLYLRGVGTQEVERSFDPAVGVVIDGVPLSFVNGSMANTFDFQSFEVLRGPQGTLFGRNTTGGVINIKRTRPTGELGVKYEGTAGSNELLDFKTVVNFPLGDMLAAKVGYAVQTGGGAFRNVTIDDDVGNADNQEINLTALYSPTERFEALVTYVNYQDENDGVPLQTRNSLNTNNPVYSNPEPVCQFGALFGAEAACEEDVTDLQRLTQDFYGRDVDFESDSLTLNMSLDVGPGTITAILGHQETDEEVPTDFDGSALNFFHAIRIQDSEQQSAEIRFASSEELSESWDFVTGLFYVEDEYSLEQLSAFGAFGGPDTALFQNPFADHEREAWAIFGEVHVDLTEQLMLTLGGRYTEEEKDYAGSMFFGGGCCVPGVPFELPGYVPGSQMDDLFVFGQPIWVPIDEAAGNETWDEFTPKVGVDYRVNDDVLTYISYSEGFRSGGFNGRNQGEANIGPFNPEYVENWELGMKGDFLDQTVRLNVAAFYNDYDDKHEEIIESDGVGGSNTVVNNAATVEIKGLEGELTWVATDNLLINANFGYLDAKYDKYLADLTGDGILTDNSDLELRRVPEWTAGLNGTYTMPVGPGELSFYASYRYTDEYWVDVANDPRGLLDDRTVYDVIIAYEWDCAEGRSVRVSAYGRDITDEVDFNSAVIVPDTIAFGGVAGGEQYGIRISGNF